MCANCGHRGELNSHGRCESCESESVYPGQVSHFRIRTEVKVYGALNNEVVGSHTEDEWQALVRKYAWRCFYCGSPMSAWRHQDGRILQIRNRNAERPWETSGKVLSFVEALTVAPENILTKDHLIPSFHNDGVRIDFIWNIRPADLRCNRLKGGKKGVRQFLNEREGLIFGWLNSLPPDDWRVLEWDSWQTDREIDAMIERTRYPCPVDVVETFPTDVQDMTREPTGVFALASGVGSDLGVDSGVDVNKQGVKAFAVASEPLPSRRLEEINEPHLLKRLRTERESMTWWKSA